MNRRNPKLPTTMLPIMPRTAQELRRLIALPNTRNQQLQEVLLTDPAAAIAVFRQLELARPGAADQVGDAAHAVSLIGMEPFRRLIESLPEVAVGDAGNRASVAYSEAAHAAFYADAISDRKGLPRQQEIATAALLQNPAVYALWTVEPEAALRASNAVRDGVPTEIAFGAELGEPLQEANRRLAEAWALPGLVRQSMGDWDDFNMRAQTVRLADEIAQATSASWHGEQTGMLTTALSDFLDLSRDESCAWLHGMAIDAARRFSRYDYPLPGFELLLMPGEIEDDDDDDLPILGRKRPHKASEPAATPAPALNLHDTLAGIMRRVRGEAGAARVMFAMLNKERSRLRTRLALGGDDSDGIRRLDLDLAEKTLFSALMTKSQSLWLNASNARKYQSLLPVSLRSMLGPQGAYLMSLFIGDKPLGLMYADGRGMSDEGYRQFRKLCQEATAVLSAGSRGQRKKAG